MFDPDNIETNNPGEIPTTTNATNTQSTEKEVDPGETSDKNPRKTMAICQTAASQDTMKHSKK